MVISFLSRNPLRSRLYILITTKHLCSQTAYDICVAILLDRGYTFSLEASNVNLTRDFKVAILLDRGYTFSFISGLADSKKYKITFLGI